MINSVKSDNLERLNCWGELLRARRAYEREFNAQASFPSNSVCIEDSELAGSILPARTVAFTRLVGGYRGRTAGICISGNSSNH